MQIPDELPVPKHHTMEIVDSSKIQSFQDCPRGFFYNYVLGLRSAGPQIHLDFGSAWHDAMETLLLHGYSDAAIMAAYENFLKTYREAFPNPVTDDDHAPKNPEYAWKALNMYAEQYKNDNFDVLYTETAGLVPIREGTEEHEARDLVVKLDSIVRDLNDGTVNSMEHKTTGRNSASWREKWSYMLQVESYTHLLYSMYPPEEVGKIIINGAVFTKSRTFDGLRMPVHKSLQQMRAFLWNVNHWIDQLEWHFEQLARTKQSHPVMKAFPINCSSCSKYGCRMGGICTNFPNPLQKFVEYEDGKPITIPPAGYEIDFWDPLRGNIDKSDNVIVKDSDGSIHIEAKTEAQKKEAEERKEKQKQKLEQENEEFQQFVPPED